MRKNIISRVLMSIRDISGGKGEAFAAILHDYNDTKVMGRDMDELTSGIKATIDYIDEKKAKKADKNNVLSV
jgi:hypothetical protein